MRIGLAIVMTFGLLIGGIVPNITKASNELNSFKDYQQIGNTYKDSMSYLVEAGVLNGYNGKINPKGELTRGEVVKMLSVLVGAVKPGEVVAPIAKSKFKDLNNHWVSGYVEKLMTFNSSIINGLPNGTFGPDQKVKKDQLAKLLVTAFNISTEAADFVNVPDSSVSNWAKIYIQALASVGIISIDSFYPTEVPNREFTSLLMHRSKEEKVRLEVELPVAKPITENEIKDKLAFQIKNGYANGINGKFGTLSTVSFKNKGLSKETLYKLSQSIFDLKINVTDSVKANTGTYQLYIPILKKSYALELKAGDVFYLFDRLQLTEEEKQLLNSIKLLDNSFTIEFELYNTQTGGGFRRLHVTPVIIQEENKIEFGETNYLFSYTQDFIDFDFMNNLLRFTYTDGIFIFPGLKNIYEEFANHLGGNQEDIIKYLEELVDPYNFDTEFYISSGTGELEIEFTYLGETYVKRLKQDPSSLSLIYLSDLIDLTDKRFKLSELEGIVTFKFTPLNHQTGKVMVNFGGVDKQKNHFITYQQKEIEF